MSGVDPGMTRRLTGMTGFYAVLGGQLISTVGSGMTRFGLGIWVLAETGNAAAYTTLLFFAVFPIGLGSLFGGPFIDRWNRRTLMIVGDVVAAAATLAIAVLYFLGGLELWHLYVSVFVNGIANALILPAWQSSTPLMVPRNKLDRASGLNQTIRAVEAILAPGLAGFIVGAFGLGVVFVVDFVTFGISTVTLLATRIPQPGASQGATARVGYWRSLGDGFRYVRERPAFVYLLSLYTVSLFLMPGLAYSLVTPLVLGFSSEEVLGLVMAAYGVGSLMGGALMAALSGRFRRMHAILTALSVAGVAAMVISLRENPWLIGAGLFITGISFVFVSASNRVIWQIKADPQVQGRVFSLQAALGVGAQSLGILIAGPLAEGLFEPLMSGQGALVGSVGELIGSGPGRGIAVMFLILGMLQLLIAVVSSTVSRVRLLEDSLPDAVDAEAVSAGRRRRP